MRAYKAVLFASLLACASLALVGAQPAAKPAAKGSSLAFKMGSFVVRPGCFLEAIGKPEKLVHEAHGPCGDKEDQATWKEGQDAWTKAVWTWMDHCTAQGTTPMAKNCPPADAVKVLKNGAEYKPEVHTWVQYYPNKRADYTGVKARIDNSLLDVRNNKLMFHESKLDFFDGYMYTANGGILGLNGTTAYNEDTEGWKMGSAAVTVNAKLGAINSVLTMNQSLFAMKNSKGWLVDSEFKQLGNAFILQDSTLIATGSNLEFWDTKQVHIVRSTLDLTNAKLTLTRANIYLWDSTLVIKNTQIMLDNSRMLLSNVGIKGDGFIESQKGIPDSAGVTPGSQVEAMNVDFKVEAEAEAVLVETAPKAAVANAGGR